jgi:dipeptidyl aminopeptidase/acylaminoacyl peptidase
MNRFRWLAPGLALAAIAVVSPAFAQDRSAPAKPMTRPATDKSTMLIPRDLLFGNPDRASVQISPDGQQLAFLSSVDGVLNVWVGPANDPAAAKPVTDDKSRGIRQYFWAFTNNHIIYLKDKGGDENWRVYSVNLATNETKDLTPFEGVAAQIQEVSDKFPNEILVALNNRDPQFHDIHRVNIDTGAMSLVLQNDAYAGILTDDTFAVRFAMRFTPDGGNELLTFNGAGEFVPYETVPMADTLTTGPAGFNKDNTVLYMTDSRGRDTGALFARDLATGTQTLLAEDARADAGATLIHPTEKTIQAVSFNFDRNRWKVLDPSIQADLDYLETLADGEMTVTGRSHDDTKWTVAFLVDDGPVKYFLYDRPARKASFLFTNRKALENLPLTKMHPQVVKSRDGLNLVNYFSLPVWSDSDEDGRPDHPLPMVLFVHGGPWARDNWGYHPYHQWLTNRGYAVMSVNFRGSTGFGKNFVNAGNMEWAGKMHDDLLDSVRWAVDNRIADPEKIAIMGGSYGGYATLVGLTFTPDVFACGVDIVGPSSIATLLNTIPPYWAPAIELFTQRVGDHRTEDGKAFLDSRSPLFKVEQITKPLLIGQGANDPRVKQSESDQIVSAMRAKNIPVTYVLFPDEGHGFARPENNIAFNAVTEAFLAQHLGGRYQPIDDDFAGSSIQVPNGSEQVPGLAGALPEATNVDAGASKEPAMK